MPITAREFLDLLERAGVMSPDHVDDLREQLAAAGVEVHPVHIARRLVEAGYLNPYFAKTLLAEGRRVSSPERRNDEELDLAPLEEEEERQNRERLLESAPPVELRIDLPPIADPDDWPLRAGEKMPPLPAARPRRGLGILTSLGAISLDLPRRRRASPLLPWAIAAAAGLLSLVLLVLNLLRR